MKKRQNTSGGVTTTKPSRLAREITDMAGAQRRLGIMDEAAKIKAYKSEALAAVHEMMEGFHTSGAIDKQTMREFDDACLTAVGAAVPRLARRRPRYQIAP